MMDCQLRDGRCVQCGWRWSGSPDIRRNCPAAVPAESACDFFALFTDRPLWRCHKCGYTCARQGEIPSRHRCHARPIEPRSDAQQAALMAWCRSNACGQFNVPLDECRGCGCTSERRERWLSRLRIGFCRHFPAETAREPGLDQVRNNLPGDPR